MSASVTLFEVGPRDGLQNEAARIATSDKIKLVDLLSNCGFAKIEVTSFVSPKWVPQMSDAKEVMSGISRREGVTYAALTPNLRGFEAALNARADEVAIFGSASEAFSQKNINCSIEESLERFQPVAEAAKRTGLPLRGYVSCVTDCPYSGPTPPEDVFRVAAAMSEMGCAEISLGETIGAGTPESVSRMLSVVTQDIAPERLAGHFHDTKGRALENIEVSLEHGLRVFDSSVGGLGGCPYAPGAKGNVATEAVVKLVENKGFTTDIDLKKLEQVAQFAKTLRSAS